MALWEVNYYPERGERHSPIDIILNIPDENERYTIARWLKFMRQHPIEDWLNVKKLTDKIWQLTAGNYRISYILDNRTIVVLHCCRKKGQQTHPKDLRRAIANFEKYLADGE